MEFIFLVGRILLGGYFTMAGINHFRNGAALTGYAASKGLPSAKTGVFISGLMLVLGGLGIVFGMFIEVSVILVIIFLLVASFTIHNFWKISDKSARQPDYINFTKNIALVGALLMLLSLLSSWNF